MATRYSGRAAPSLLAPNLIADDSPGNNAPPFSVSELSGALKRTVEDAFGHVRVRGEISGWKRHASGHCYLTLKDERACMDGVIWKGSAGALRFRPEDGIEVVGVRGAYSDYMRATGFSNPRRMLAFARFALGATLAALRGPRPDVIYATSPPLTMALPALVVVPVWTAALLIGGFFLVNKLLYTLLNSKEAEYHSDPKYAPARPEHAHEQWIYINGVAAG